MRFDASQNVFHLATKKRFYAHGGTLGLDSTGQYLTEGWDSGVAPENFTAREKREIARYMISLWRKWGDLPHERRVKPAPNMCCAAHVDFDYLTDSLADSAESR